MRAFTPVQLAAAGILSMASVAAAIPICAADCFSKVIAQHPPLDCKLPSMYDCFCDIAEMQGYYIQCVNSDCGSRADSSEAIQFGVELCLEIGYTIAAPTSESTSVTSTGSSDSSTTEESQTSETGESTQNSETGTTQTSEVSETSETTQTGEATETSETTQTETTETSETGEPTATPSLDDEYTTSTIYATKTYTITSCAPTITKCPIGHVTTETVAVTTTVCPKTEKYTVSTVYTTKVHTITACPQTVTKCPVGHVTTETIPVSTTICPLTSTPPKTTAPWPCHGCNSTVTGFSSLTAIITKPSSNPTKHVGSDAPQPTKSSGDSDEDTPKTIAVSLGTSAAVSSFVAIAGAAFAFFGLL
ncbi:hypothetical protein B0T10DRAFT_605174 [Thelonectria olida]|uniref:CFEM domain-containing protein n=1 Tax=Thelonectria olida TaxID=1576542 RepID=A0A9P9AR69_9HYPO|nr:hypothetical protein B0T10DRAFT_605174 [Thelonectria olida]